MMFHSIVQLISKKLPPVEFHVAAKKNVYNDHKRPIRYFFLFFSYISVCQDCLHVYFKQRQIGCKEDMRIQQLSLNPDIKEIL